MITLPKTPSFRLEGKRALVTGASSGIGLGCAAALAEAGAQVTLLARKSAPLIEACAAIEAQGGTANYHTLDISDIEATAELIEQEGPFDILLNSAGLARHTPARDTQPEDFDAVHDLNVRGAYFLTRNCANALVKAKKPGSLINVASQMAFVGGVDRAVYCATKHAVQGFTKAMAIEFGPHRIRINTLSPTFIRTPLTAGTFDDPSKVAWIEEKIKLGRVGEIEDIMGGAVFLASEAASLITGTSLLIDGGWTAG